MQKLVQSWWHFEDKTKPSNGRFIRQVLDIFTDESFFSFEIPSSFVKLKVRNRLTGGELEFLQNNKEFQVNLGKIENYPKYNNCFHIRIEIDYVDVNPNYQKTGFFKTGYHSTCEIKEITQPEFYITVPLGMKLKNNSFFFFKNLNANDFIRLLLLTKIKNKEHFKILTLENKMFTDYENDNKLSYSIIIDENSYNQILQDFNNDKVSLESIQLDYTVVNQNKYWLIPLFPILLILLSIFYLNSQDLSFINFSAIIIYISFLTFYYSLIKEGYEIPINKSLYISMPLSGIMILFPMIFSIV